MTFLERIKNELFIKECFLVEEKNPYYYGKSTSNNEIFYFIHEFGYVIYLPRIGETKKVFDPINPSSFNWHMFNNQIIFVPTSNMPYKTFFKLHPDLKDYAVRFNLEYLRKYRSVWVETENPNLEFYFLIRRAEQEKDDELIFKNAHIMPEFQRSNTCLINIKQDNIDDVWKHWLLEEHGHSITQEYYRKNYKNEEWIASVIGELVVKNLTEKNEKPILDPDLKRLLGMTEPQSMYRRYDI